MDKILFFDTETNGLPKNYQARPRGDDNWPRMTQLAFVLCDKEGNEIEVFHSKIKPDGWVVPDEEFFVKNGITTEDCDANGIPAQFALAAFVNAVNQSATVVAHNLNFDFGVVGSELIRYKMAAGNKPGKFCTMVALTDIMQLPGKYGNKWPSLAEAHKFCTDKEAFDGAHAAINDTKALAELFFAGVKKGHFTT